MAEMTKEEQILSEIAKNPEAFLQIPNPSREFTRAAIYRNPDVFRHIKNPDRQIIEWYAYAFNFQKFKITPVFSPEKYKVS